MEFSISLQPDEEGYTGRECPACEKYFKIKFGTGLPGDVDAHCPYCNHIGPHKEFFTKQQIEYAHSVVLNKVSNDFHNAMKKLERKPDRNQFVSIGITVKGNPIPITHYSETELEEKITCDCCTLQYAIYGVFGFCPDCGIHNSKQMLDANFELILKMLEFASTADKAIADRLIENAIEDAISSFDGFGREICNGTIKVISFQNIEAASKRLLEVQGLDIANGVDVEDWQFVKEQFQKRHLLAHRMGVIDEEYQRKTNGDTSMIGRKVSITTDDVERLIRHLRTISNTLFTGISVVTGN
jgi:hypothetical protein